MWCYEAMPWATLNAAGEEIEMPWLFACKLAGATNEAGALGRDASLPAAAASGRQQHTRQTDPSNAHGSTATRPPPAPTFHWWSYVRCCAAGSSSAHGSTSKHGQRSRASHNTQGNAHASTSKQHPPPHLPLVELLRSWWQHCTCLHKTTNKPTACPAPSTGCRGWSGPGPSLPPAWCTPRRSPG